MELDVVKGVAAVGPNNRHIVVEETTSLPARSKLSFLGAGVTAADDAGGDRTTVTIPGGSGSGGHTIEEETTALTARTKLSFQGAGVTATDNAGQDRTIITIPGATSFTGIPATINGVVQAPFTSLLIPGSQALEGSVASGVLNLFVTHPPPADPEGSAGDAQAFAIQRANHTGTQSADTLTDGTTNKAFLATEQTKLAGIATGATANSSDATLLARANHTGTQLLATISDAGTAASHAHGDYATAAQGALAGTALQLNPALGTPVSGVATNLTGTAAGLTAGSVTTNANLTGPVTSTGNATAIANGAISNAMLANSAVANLSGTNTGDNATNSQYSGLVSNATHTGDVTGSGALTLANIPAISGANLTTLNASNLSTGTVGVARMASGTVIQVVWVTPRTDTTTSTSTSFTSILAGSITTRVANSRVIVEARIGMGVTATYGLFVRIARSSTPLVQGDAASSRTRTGLMGSQGATVGGNQVQFAPQGSDVPGTVGSYTYNLEVAVESGATAYINRSVGDQDAAYSGRSAVTMVIYEIAP